jgi:hypothetical protein
MIQMKLLGEKALLKKFGEIKADMYKALAASLVAGGFVVTNAAKTEAPYVTGNLRRSIHLGTKTNDITTPQATDGAPQPVNTGVVAQVAEQLRGRGRTEILAGTDVVYAPSVEFNHHPYLRPALDNNEANVNKEVGRAINMVIKKASR